jgi:phenylacetaldehyde dehydrogenase
MSSQPSPLRAPSAQAQAFLVRSHQLLIGDAWRSGNAEPIPVENPARETLISQVDAAAGADLDLAVAAARKALAGPWGRMNGRQRAAVLFRFADLLDAKADLVGEIMALESGSPITSCRMVVRLLAVETFRYYAGWATKIAGESFNPSLGGARAELDILVATLREPIGVVGLIVPWNATAGQIGLKVAPALAAGCTVVLKTAELSPLTGALIAELMLEAGAPPGVLNLLHGRGVETGAAMAAHPGIDKISFTGSTAVGREIVKAATGNLKKVTLELGGKSPVVVFPDADLQSVIPGAAMACYLASGQACMAGTRLFLHEDIHDEVIDGVAAFARTLKMGDTLEPDTMLGPLVSRTHKARVESYIQSGRDEGARLAFGGEPWDGPGHFVRPVLFADANMSMRIAKEEIFGPVLTAIRFSDESAMLAEVNSTQYGLSGSVWTRDIQRALRVAKGIDSGQVGINIHAAVSPETPFGGNRQSGWGREFGEEALAAYLKTKAISVNIGAKGA